MKKIRISEIEHNFWYDKTRYQELKEEAKKIIEYAKNTTNEIILCEYLEGTDYIKRKAVDTIEKALEEGIEIHRRNMGYAHVWVVICKPGTLAKINELEERIKTLRVELNKLVNELKECE